MTIDTQERTQALRQRWADNVTLIDEHIELEKQLLTKVGSGSIVATLALLIFTSVYATKIGALVSAATLAVLALMFFRSWYVLVGIIHDRETLIAKLEDRVLISFAPSILGAIMKPITHRESAWPGLFVIPQAVALALITVAVTYFLGADQTLFGSLKDMLFVALPATLIGSVLILGGLAIADQRA